MKKRYTAPCRVMFRTLSLSILLCSGNDIQADPAWWSDPLTSIQGDSAPNDWAPANLGQLKFVASQAKLHLDIALESEGGAGPAVEAACQFTQADNFAPVAAGQLKHIAKPFYDRLAEVRWNWQTTSFGTATTPYPWTGTTHPENLAPINIGQLKHVFAFDLTAFAVLDNDNDGMPDRWELAYGLNPAVAADANADPDGDGRTNIQAYVAGDSPLVSIPAPVLLLSGHRSATFHHCQESLVPNRPTETAGNGSQSYPPNPPAPQPPDLPASILNPSLLNSNLAAVWPKAIYPPASEMTVTPMGHQYAAINPLININPSSRIAFSEGIYSTTPLAGSSYAHKPYGSSVQVLDGETKEFQLKLYSKRKPPQTIRRHFAITRRQYTISLNAPPGSNPIYTYTAPVVQTAEISSASPATEHLLSNSVTLFRPAINTPEDGMKQRSERTAAEISLLADTSRDGAIGPEDEHSHQPAVYLVNYHCTGDRSDGNTQLEDAVHWQGEDDGNKQFYPDGQQKRLIRAQHEDRSLAPLAQGVPLPKKLTPLRIPAMAFGHPQLKVFLRLPYGQVDKRKAFHIFIAKTNNTTEPVTIGGRSVPAGYKGWEHVWGGINTPLSPLVITELSHVANGIAYADITRYVNPQAPNYIETRPPYGFGTTPNPNPYEFALEGLLFRGMPYPDDEGIARYGDNDSPNPVFDGLLRLGLEFHMNASHPGNNLYIPGNQEYSNAAIGGVADWVSLTCVPSIPLLPGPSGTPVMAPLPDLPAFTAALELHSAHGYGKYAVGGRYGHVFTVTSNSDDGTDPNSLRYAIESPVPRTIIFALPQGTDGTIHLNNDLFVKFPYCTIAGQTAFRNGSLGICLKNFGLRVTADDVIVRHIRSRPGNDEYSGATAPRGGEGGNVDSFSVEGVATRVIFDHCTGSFSSDCLMDIATGKQPSVGGQPQPYFTRANRRITVQHCLFAWPQDYFNHWEKKQIDGSTVSVKQEHGYGTLVRAGYGAGVTLWGNLYAHCRTRIPRAAGLIVADEDNAGLRLDFVNNIIYGWGDKGTSGNTHVEDAAGYDTGDTDVGNGLGKYNLAHNLYRSRNPVTAELKRWFEARNQNVHAWVSGNRHGLSLLDMPPNQYRHHAVPYEPQSIVLKIEAPASLATFTSGVPAGGWPSDEFSVPAASANSLFLMERTVGAYRKRDTLDILLLGAPDSPGQYQQLTGTIIDDPSAVGGWPVLPAAAPPPDADGDGLPDTGSFGEIDTQSRLDPRSALMDRYGEGHTALEEYLNHMVP